MARHVRIRRSVNGNRSYNIQVIGARRIWFGDWYYAILRLPWAVVLVLLAVFFLAINVLFAFGYLAVGGVAHAVPGSLRDAFYFSVQTMGTIGYGAMYPESDGANALMVAESVVSLIVTALATGLIFAKFARPVGRVVFAKHAAIAPMDGVPTLMVRVGNERGNSIVEAQARVTLMRTMRTLEGHVFYRMMDLQLVRDRSAAVTRSWTLLHKIEGASPFVGMTPESMAQSDAEIMVSLTGTDDTSYQPVHARFGYESGDILWGSRHADVLSEAPNGDLTLDVRKFHLMEPTKPTDVFPYPASPSTEPLPSA